MLCLKVALNRHVFSVLYPFLKKRERATAGTFDGTITRFGRVRARLAVRLGQRFALSCEERRCHGEALARGLAGRAGLQVPQWDPADDPVLNRMPVIVEDPRKKAELLRQLRAAGYQASEFYFKPLHHIFDLGYDRASFPHAVRLAEGLVTLPVHPLVTERDIDAMIDVIKNCIR
jgi:dTDP-4-amino-4,6-dideoxygalactose transaminase